MGFGGIFIYRKINEEMPPSNLWGKSAAVLFFLICLALMLRESIPPAVTVSALCLAFAVSLCAFVSYFRTLVSVLKRKETE